MPSIARRISLIALIFALLAGCAPNSYIVRASDLDGAHSRDAVIGAVYGRCRESAIRVDRLEEGYREASPWPDYVSVREQTSRAKSFGVGLGSVVVGVGLASMGTLMLMQSRSSDDPSRLFLGRATPTLGVVSIAGGVGLTGFGIATGARGARLGAEASRRWEPSMTSEVPCVVEQRTEAVHRARLRSPAATAPANDLDPRPHPSRTRALVSPTPEAPLGDAIEGFDGEEAPDVR